MVTPIYRYPDLSHARDYKAVDGLTTVTFISRTPTGDETFTVQFADAHEYTVREVVASGGFYGLGDRRWGIGRLELPAANAPKPGDSILDAQGVLWELIEPGVLDDQNTSWFVGSRKAR